MGFKLSSSISCNPSSKRGVSSSQPWYRLSKLLPVSQEILLLGIFCCGSNISCDIWLLHYNATSKFPRKYSCSQEILPFQNTWPPQQVKWQISMSRCEDGTRPVRQTLWLCANWEFSRWNDESWGFVYKVVEELPSQEWSSLLSKEEHWLIRTCTCTGWRLS